MACLITPAFYDRSRRATIPAPIRSIPSGQRAFVQAGTVGVAVAAQNAPEWRQLANPRRPAWFAAKRGGQGGAAARQRRLSRRHHGAHEGADDRIRGWNRRRLRGASVRMGRLTWPSLAVRGQWTRRARRRCAMPLSPRMEYDIQNIDGQLLRPERPAGSAAVEVRAASARAQ